jgi:hypothetical protein
MSASYSGLNARDRAVARRLFIKGVEVLMAHPVQLHYSQDMTLRWEGIHDEIVPWFKSGRLNGRYPKHGDCSSTGTYLMWLALAHHFHLPDRVNGQNWYAGFTGTLLDHGKTIHDLSRLKIGDAIIYGRSAGATSHVAWAIGGRRAFSHGGDAGPFIVDFEYRPDRVGVRRYI